VLPPPTTNKENKMNPHKETEIAKDLIDIAETLRQTAQTFSDLIDNKGYQPESTENAVVFMAGIKLSADALTNLLKAQSNTLQFMNTVLPDYKELM
jgi:hypothetical protein